MPYLQKPASAALVLACLCCSTVFAEEAVTPKVDVSYEKIGAPEKCITTARIKNTRIMSDDSIVFIMRGDRLFLSELPNTCRGLAKGGNFSRPDYQLNHRKMCSGDIFHPFLGGTCRFGSFQEIKLIITETQEDTNAS